MTVHEQVAELKQQAIAILISERDRIDAELATLGAMKNPAVKRGRKPKSATTLRHAATATEARPDL